MRRASNSWTRNWRAAGGELDLAALERETLVFVEVKTRRNGFAGYPRVSGAQRRRIVNASRAFRRRFGVVERSFRFDLVTVLWPADGKPVVEHFEDAHQAR